MAQSATKYFKATDSDGVAVHGYVEVHRPTNPNDPHFGNDRAADRYFQFWNTRDACLIDPAALKAEMSQALEDALKGLGMDAPNRARIDRDAALRLRQ